MTVTQIKRKQIEGEDREYGTMDILNQLKRQYVDYLSNVYREGILDDQFLQIQKLQDETNPEFLNEVVTLYIDDSEKLLRSLATTLDLQNVDYNKVDAFVHQFKGSSSSIGAQRVTNVCVAFKTCYDNRNLDGCLRCLQQVRDEYYLVKGKLQILSRLEQQIVATGGSIPVMI